MDELLKILSELRPDIDFTKNRQLIDEGVLDSFDIISLVGAINEKFDIEIGVEDLVPENFNSADAMFTLITHLQDEN